MLRMTIEHREGRREEAKTFAHKEGEGQTVRSRPSR